ncbi:MAG: CRTAC1 family protein, partial [Deltaproteobacteria bacterium]|nr:CRTAC1 family protein [Deltaproteobacteria bacterium]
DGTFTDWTEGQGFAYGTQRAGRGVSPLDYDFDGDVDIFVSNYRLNANWFYQNDGDGTFNDVAWLNGLAGYEANGYYGHTIGSVWGDFDNDGDFDMLQSNLAHPRFYHFSDRTLLMLNNGSGVFENYAEAAGLHYRETHSNPTVADFDLDGSWDLFITATYNGRFSEMYLNNGDATFEQVNYESGAIIHNGWGSAASDFDQDGDVDLVASNLYRNDGAAFGSWLQVRTLGGETGFGTVNAAGIGAIVKVTASDLELLSHTAGGSGTGCQDSQFLTFGLGAETTVDQIDVYYPGGTSVTVDGPIVANQRVWIQADGTVTYGWAPPM